MPALCHKSSHLNQTNRVNHNSSNIAPFIRTLAEILTCQYTCIEWSEHGNAFDIVDISKFTKEIIPKYFRHSKFTSFQRQLNYFGFRKKSRRHSNVSTYAHKYFSQNRPDEATWIKRKSTTRLRPKGPRSRVVLAYTQASLEYTKSLLKPIEEEEETRYKSTSSVDAKSSYTLCSDEYVHCSEVLEPLRVCAIGRTIKNSACSENYVIDFTQGNERPTNEQFDNQFWFKMLDFDCTELKSNPVNTLHAAGQEKNWYEDLPIPLLQSNHGNATLFNNDDAINWLLEEFSDPNIA